MDGNSLCEFPTLSLADLQLLALGTYQQKQARSYYAEHINPDGSYEVQLCKHCGPLSLSSHGILAESPMLIRGRIQSRHRSQTKYLIYVLVDK